MDDDQVIREVGGVLIEALGHEVEFAVDGEEAIKKYLSALQSERPFNAVILDLIIRTGMGGVGVNRAGNKGERDVGARLVITGRISFCRGEVALPCRFFVLKRR